MFKNIFSKVKSGFTLIELLVSLAVFVVIVVVIISIFVSMTQSRRYYSTTQNLQDNGRFLMERIIKEIRMSRIIKSAQDNKSLSIEIHPSESGVKRVDYQFDNGVIKRAECDPPPDPTSNCLSQDLKPISSSDVAISGEFLVKTDPVSPAPRVTITMQIKPKGADSPVINIQNTVTPR